MKVRNLLSAVCMLAICCATHVCFSQTGEEELVTVTFIIPQDGSLAHKVSMEASGDTPEREFLPDEDGITYHLPKDKEIWFEVTPDEEAGYFVSQWLIDDVPFAYSSYLNAYAVTVYEGLKLEVEFERDDVFYTVEYTAPEGTMIRCINRSETDPEKASVNSGDPVLAASNVLFMISPENNPDGKVNLKHWIINGHIYQDAVGDPITDNSIEFKLLHNVQIEAVVDEDVSILSPHLKVSARYDSAGKLVVLSGLQPGERIRMFDQNGLERVNIQAQDSNISFSVSELPQGIYLMETNQCYLKLLIY